jgi:SAM-dependent methyltransferase
LLQAAIEIPGDSIAKQMKLRRDYPAEKVRSALTLWDVRERARSKFGRADEMFFDRDGLEQASGDVIAAHRAKRYVSFDRVADLCCGVGGDSAVLAKLAKVTSVDIRPDRTVMTRLNVEENGQSVQTVCADVRHWRLTCEAVFIDTS